MEENRKKEIQRILKEQFRNKLNDYRTYLQEYHYSLQQLEHTINECYEYFEGDDEFLQEVIGVEREL